MAGIIKTWLQEDSKEIGKKLISARIPLTTAYKIELLTKDFDKSQTEIIQAGLDVGLSALIDEWRGMQTKGTAMPIDEEINLMVEAGHFFKSTTSNTTLSKLEIAEIEEEIEEGRMDYEDAKREAEEF